MAQPSTNNCRHCGCPCVVGREQIEQKLQCIQCGKSFIAGAAAEIVGTNTGVIPGPRQGNAMATASVVCGLLGCIPFASFLAIIFGIIGLRKSKDPRVDREASAITGIVLGCLGMLTAQRLYYYFWWNMSQTADRVKCASNVRQIRQAILDYSNVNLGRYPQDLGTLIKT
jgi:hypothetical protein